MEYRDKAGDALLASLGGLTVIRLEEGREGEEDREQGDGMEEGGKKKERRENLKKKESLCYSGYLTSKKVGKKRSLILSCLPTEADLNYCVDFSFPTLS